MSLLSGLGAPEPRQQAQTGALVREGSNRDGAYRPYGVLKSRGADKTRTALRKSREFLDGERLTGQASLGEKQVFAGDQSHIGRDHVPSGELHEITRYQPSDRLFLKPSVT